MSSTARRFTRCCDAQGARAVVLRKMPCLPPVVVAALIVRAVPSGKMYRFRKNAIVTPRSRLS